MKQAVPRKIRTFFQEEIVKNTLKETPGEKEHPTSAAVMK